MIHFVFILSIGLQIAAFAVAVRLLFRTKARWTPVLFGAVVLLMAIRRVVSYMGFLHSGYVPASVSVAEWTALVISACLLAAIVFSGRGMESLQREIASVARQHALLDSLEKLAVTGSWWYEKPSGTMRWSQQLYRVLGEDPRQTPPSFKYFTSLVHPEDVKRVRERFQELEKEKQEIEVRHRIVRRDGTTRSLHVTVRKFQDDPGKIEWFGLVRDITELQAVQGELTQTEARYKALYETAPVSIWLEDFTEVAQWLDTLREKGVFDIESYLTAHPKEVRQAVHLVKIKDVNHYTLELYEADSREALLASLEAVLTEASYGFFLMELVALFNLKWALRFECSQQTVKGRPLTVILEWAVPEVAGVRDLSNAIVTVVDITGRKRKEKEAESALRRLREAQGIAHLGSWEWDIVSGKLLWSKEVYRIFGRDPATFAATYDGFLACIHPDDRLAVEQAVDAALRKDVEFQAEHRVLRPDGSVVFVSERGNVSRNEADEPVLMLGTVLDVTERTESMRQIKESERKYRFLMESFPQMVFSKDIRGVYLTVNRTLASAIGYTIDEVIGKTDFDLVDRDLAEKYLSEDQQVLASGEKLRVDHTYTRADGREGVLETIKYPIQDEGGNIAGIQGISSDVTELRQARQSLERRMKELSTLNQILRSVTGVGDVKRTAQLVLREIRKSLGNVIVFMFLCQDGVLSLVHEEGGAASFNEALKSREHEVGNCLCGLAAAEGEPLYSHDIRADIRCTMEECKMAGVHSAAALPLRSGGEVLGVFYVGSFSHRNLQAEREFLEAAAGELAIALNNAMLMEQARRHTEELEMLVQERTKNLESKIKEIERMNKLFVDRELKMVELKEEIAALENSIEREGKEEGNDNDKES